MHVLGLSCAKIEMSVFTTGQYDSAIWTPVKTVYATHTEGVSILRGFVAGVGGIMGGKQDVLNKKMDDVTEKVMRKIRGMVDSDQCIVGLSIQLTSFGRQDTNSTISALAMGTLLKRREQGGGNRKTRARRTRGTRRR